jgi:hypothetical protein
MPAEHALPCDDRQRLGSSRFLTCRMDDRNSCRLGVRLLQQPAQHEQAAAHKRRADTATDEPCEPQAIAAAQADALGAVGWPIDVRPGRRAGRQILGSDDWRWFWT